MVFGLKEMWSVPTDRRLFIATVPVLTLGVMGRSAAMTKSCEGGGSLVHPDLLYRASISTLCIRQDYVFIK